MAVYRPSFSQHSKPKKAKPVNKKKVKVKPSVTKKKVKVKKKAGKGRRVFLYLLLIGLLFFEGQWPPSLEINRIIAGENNREGHEVFVKRGDHDDDHDVQTEEDQMNTPAPREVGDNIDRESENLERTTILGDVGLSTEQMRTVAENILSVANSMTEEFEVADGLTLSMYVLRYLAEIGEYDLAHKDIMILVNAFEKLSGKAVSEEVRHILNQVRKIRFGKKDGQFFSQFFSKNPEVGIVIPIEQVNDDPKSSLKEIRHVLAKEGSRLSFNEVDNVQEKKKVREFIKNPVKVLGVFESLASSLNQVHPKIQENIDDYLEQPEHPAPPLIIKMEGISVEVATSTVFKDIEFEFQESYAFPAIKEEEKAIPSFVLGAQAKLLKLKVSVDQ